MENRDKSDQLLDLLLAAPCHICQYAIELYGIKHIEHT
jgi:hypothetical protein